MSSTPRVLVVDDDPDISLALEDYLSQEEFVVEVADSGNDALEKGLTRHFDAIILDVGLPDRDGIEVLRELAEQKPKLPIILLTAFTTLSKSTPPDTFKKAFAYLIKPYSREEIRDVLRRAVFGTQKSEHTSETPALHFQTIAQSDPKDDTGTTGPSYQLSLDEYQRLAEYVQLMQFAFDQIPEAILVADTEKRFRFANRAAYNTLGYNKEELEALRIPDIAPDHTHQRYLEHLNKMRQGKTLCYDAIHRTKLGQNLLVTISVYLLNFHGKEFTCAIAKRPHTQPIPSQ